MLRGVAFSSHLRMRLPCRPRRVVAILVHEETCGVEVLIPKEAELAQVGTVGVEDLYAVVFPIGNEQIPRRVSGDIIRFVELSFRISIRFHSNGGDKTAVGLVDADLVVAVTHMAYCQPVAGEA